MKRSTRNRMGAVATTIPTILAPGNIVLPGNHQGAKNYEDKPVKRPHSLRGLYDDWKL